jgi:hypothetical protein
MTKTITISDEMAALLEKQRRVEGQATLNDAAELAIARGLIANDGSGPTAYSGEELRSLIEEGRRASTEVWYPDQFRADVVAAYARKAR